MTRRTVAVRLVAENGQQIRAEFAGVGRAGKQAFEEIASGQKSAEASARVFEQALEEEVRAFRSLRASIDPAFAATQRYQQVVRATSQAVRAGAASQAQANRVLALARQEYTAAGRAAAGLNRRFDLRNVSLQLSQVAQQATATGDPLRALAIQLPDLAIGFGPLGILIGAAAGALLPLAINLVRAGDAAEDGAGGVETFADRMDQARAALQRAEDAISLSGLSGLDRVEEQFGAITVQVVNLIDALEDLERRTATRALSQVLDEAIGRIAVNDVFDGIGAALLGATEEDIAAAAAVVRQLRADIAQLQGTGQPVPFALTENLREAQQELAALRGQFEDAGDLFRQVGADAETVQQIAALEQVARTAIGAADFAGVAEALQDIRRLLGQTGATIDQEVIDGLIRAETEARSAARSLGQIGTGADEAAEGISSAADQADRLAGNLSSALRELDRMELGRHTAERRAAAQLRARAATVGDPAGRAAALAREDFNEDTGTAAYALIRSGNWGQLGRLNSAGVARRARDQAAAEAALRAAEEAFRDRQRDAASRGGGAGLSEADRTALRERNQLEREAARITRSVRTELEDYNAERARLQRLLDANLISTETFNRAMETATETFNEAQFDQVYDGIRSLSQVIGENLDDWEGLADGVANVLERIRNDILTSQIEDALMSVLQPLLDAQGAGGSGNGSSGSWITAALAGLFGGGSPGAGGPPEVPSFEGGGHTGYGPRLGGLDGRGGYLAMVHPRERVIDETQPGGRAAASGMRIAVEVFVKDDGKLAAIARTEGAAGGAMAAQKAAPGIINGHLVRGGADRVLEQRYGTRPRAR